MSKNIYFIDDAEDNFGQALVLNGPWSDSLIKVIIKEEISVLRLSESAGWNDSNVDFLEKLSSLNLRGVEIYSWDIKDIEPLKYLSNLEYIGLQCEFTKAPDFSEFKKLTHFFSEWRPKVKTVLNCFGLELLNIVNYPFENIKDLKEMEQLKSLELTSRKLVSLNGIEKLISLEFIDLFSCPNLESLDGIKKLSKLKRVELESCKKINDVSDFGELVHIQKAR